MPYIVGKLKRSLFNKLKNTLIGYLVREKQSREVSGLNVGNSQDCPGATPTTLKGGGSCRGLQKHIYGGTSWNGGEKPLLVPLEASGQTANPNREP